MAHPALREVLDLTGQPENIGGRLFGGRHAGVQSDGWPCFSLDGGRLDGLRVHSNPKLDRYVAVMGLRPVDGMLGVQDSADDPAEWASSGWTPELPAVIAQLILEQPPDLRANQIRQRLPMLAGWAA